MTGSTIRKHAGASQRRHALQRVRASFALDNIKLNQADLDELEPYIRGELTTNEFIQTLRGKWASRSDD